MMELTPTAVGASFVVAAMLLSGTLDCTHKQDKHTMLSGQGSEVCVYIDVQ